MTDDFFLPKQISKAREREVQWEGGDHHHPSFRRNEESWEKKREEKERERYGSRHEKEETELSWPHRCLLSASVAESKVGPIKYIALIACSVFPVGIFKLR